MHVRASTPAASSPSPSPVFSAPISASYPSQAPRSFLIHLSGVNLAFAHRRSPFESPVVGQPSKSYQHRRTRMTTKSPFESLPNEILDNILAHARVNDQICLAYTSKHFLDSIATRKDLDCNSHHESIRYEAWRFTWIGDPWPPNFPRTFSKRDVQKLLPKSRSLVERHMTRLKRLSRKNLRLRMIGSNAQNEPRIKVPTSRYELRKPSTRRAAIAATAKIHKMGRR